MRRCDNPSETTEYRFWQQIEYVPCPNPNLQGDCWEWQGKPNKEGYGTIFVGKNSGRKVVNEYVHRWAYEHFAGPIPPDMTIDHRCRNRRCCNPAHHEPVTQGENTRRGESFSTKFRNQTHCKRGHPLSGDNLYTWRGMRHCRECAKIRNQRAQAKKASTPSTPPSITPA